MSWHFLIPLVLQVGPMPNDSAISAMPQELRDREMLDRQQRAQIPPAPVPTPHQQCLQLANDSPAAGQEQAETWIEIAKGAETAQAKHCLGFALSKQGDWAAAGQAFSAARLDADPKDHPYRARLAAMAGNAALAAGNAAGAIELFKLAQGDAGQGGDTSQLADITTDRARALVAVNRTVEAAETLATARQIDPDNGRAWLLSATLSRRMDQLPDAQQQIEQAARLDSANPEVGLEAGVIAVLSGRDDAARKSWQSVISLSPNSAAASIARDYIAQLDGAH